MTMNKQYKPFIECKEIKGHEMTEEVKEFDYHYIRHDTLPIMKKVQELHTALDFRDIEPLIFICVKAMGIFDDLQNVK